MVMSNESFNNPGIAPAMSQLSGLRKLHLWFYAKDSLSLHTSHVQAHIVWQLVRNVPVSELLMVTEDYASSDYDWKRARWASWHQGLFAQAVVERIAPWGGFTGIQSEPPHAPPLWLWLRYSPPPALYHASLMTGPLP